MTTTKSIANGSPIPGSQIPSGEAPRSLRACSLDSSDGYLSHLTWALSYLQTGGGIRLACGCPTVGATCRRTASFQRAGGDSAPTPALRCRARALSQGETVPFAPLMLWECRFMVVEARPWLESVARRYPYDYALVDVETTGLDPAKDRIIQIAVAQVSAYGVTQHTWSRVIDPGCDPGPVEIHGFTREHVAKQPPYSSVMAELAGLLSGRVLVAHNARFDWRFLAAESRRANHELPVDRRLCTIDLTRQLDLPVARLSLDAVASYFGITRARAHDATDDMRVMSEVLLQLLTAAEQVELALPFVRCDPADSRGAYPMRITRRVCPWSYPGKWVPGDRLVQGMKVAITGATTVPRETLTERAVDAGLDVMNTVSGRTSVLVTNDPDLATGKIRNARKHGVPIVTEPAFADLLRNVVAGVAMPEPETVPASAPPAPSPVTEPVSDRPDTVAAATGVSAGRRYKPSASGPLSGRCLLVLGGLHHEAAETRSRIGALGGIAAVNLTPRVTGVVPLTGAEKERRWTRIRTLRVPICDPSTFEPLPADEATDGPSLQPPRPVHDDAESVPAQVLPRGAVVDLPTDVRSWSVSVGWPRRGGTAPAEVDVVAFLTDQDDEVRADSDFVFYNATASADGSVELTLDLANEALVDLRLDLVPDDVERITLAATIPDGHTFGEIGPIELVVRTDTGVTHIRATLDAATTEQSLLLACVYRRVDRWRFRAVGQGYESGLAELATSYGVSIDD
jgi:DNA polymerase III subunit epsilon